MTKLNDKQNKALFWLLLIVWLMSIVIGIDITSFLIDGGYLFDNKLRHLGIVLYWMFIGGCGAWLDKFYSNRKNK